MKYLVISFVVFLFACEGVLDESSGEQSEVESISGEDSLEVNEKDSIVDLDSLVDELVIDTMNTNNQNDQDTVTKVINDNELSEGVIFALDFEEELESNRFYMLMELGSESSISSYTLTDVSDKGIQMMVVYPTMKLTTSSDELGYEPYGFYAHFFNIKEFPLFWSKTQQAYFKDIESVKKPLDQLEADSPYLNFEYQQLEPTVKRVSINKNVGEMVLQCPQFNIDRLESEMSKFQLGVYQDDVFTPLCEYESNHSSSTKIFKAEAGFENLTVGLRGYGVDGWVLLY